MKQIITHTLTKTTTIFVVAFMVFGVSISPASAQYYDSWSDGGYYDSWSDSSYYDSWSDDYYYDSWSDGGYYDSWSDDYYYDSWSDDSYYDSWSDGGYYDSWSDSSYYDSWGDDYYYDSWSDDYYTYDDGYHYDYNYVDYGYDWNYGGGGFYGGNYNNYPDRDYPVCKSFSASPNLLPADGGTVTISWDTKDADVVNISGIGSVSKDGTRSIFVNDSRDFTLTAQGDGYTARCHTSVHVAFAPTPNPEPQEPEAQNPWCDSFYATPSVLSNGGGTTTLVWGTTFATNVSIDNGIGQVSLDGSRSVSLSDSEVYTLTAQNVDGDTVTCTAGVTVLDDIPTSHDDDDNNLSCDTFYASPSRVDEGEDFRLHWRTTDADEVFISNGIGFVSDDGSIEIEADDHDEFYRLTARNGNDEVTCTVTVNVDEEDDRSRDRDRPRCDLDASDDDIDEGDRVRLSWDNTRADDIRLRDNHGEEYFDTRHSSRDRREYDEDDDSIYVYPDEDTRFTLTVYNDDGSRTCAVRIDVDENGGSVASANITRTGQVAGIALSNVPYTGFEAGPLLTSIFYTIIALWGAGIAYFVVVRPFARQTKGDTAVIASQIAEPVVAPSENVEVPVMEEAQPADRRSALRKRAEEERILLAPDAAAFIREQATAESDQLYLFNKIVDLAKATFPMEDGWIALDRKRLESIIEEA